MRAIAVIAVMLFHFNAPWGGAPGGFSGVDVFFVISGFLMTGIIFRGITQANFSILKFYVARANRIIPALAFLCLVLLIFAWFYLPPLDYQALGKRVASSVGFLSNIFYWKEAGYFDALTHKKWLLHTWSLSVEWQFYLLYPLLLVAMRKFMSIKTMKATLLLGTILGFIFCIIVSELQPNTAYYLLPARAWEMTLGGVAYLYPFKLNDNKKRLLEWAGLALIIAAYMFISKEDLWPGYLSLIPVMGAFFMIQAQRNDSIITGNIIFQKIGKWSYSIYLWHWPLVVAIYYFELGNKYTYIGMVLSIFLGFVSYKYIETIRFRTDFTKITDCLKCKPVYMALVIGLLGGVVFVTKGVESHYSTKVIITNQSANDKNPKIGQCMGNILRKVPECIYGEGKLGAIVLGDSHAQSIVRSVEKSLPDNSSVLDWTQPSCYVLRNYNGKTAPAPDNQYWCGNFIAYALNKVKKYPNIPIVISNRYPPSMADSEEKYSLLVSRNPTLSSLNSQIPWLNPATKDIIDSADKYYNAKDKAYIDTVCQFAKNNPVFILERIPEFKYVVPRKMATRLMRGNTNFRIKLPIKAYNNEHIRFNNIVNSLQKQCNVTFIPVKDKFCDESFCYGDIDDRPILYDAHHLSEFGASQLIPRFKKLITPKIPPL